MRFCANCGEKLDDDARWCSKCGTQVMQPGMQQTEQTNEMPQSNYYYNNPQGGNGLPENRPVKKSSKLPVIALIAGIVVVALIALIVLIPGENDDAENNTTKNNGNNSIIESGTKSEENNESVTGIKVSEIEDNTNETCLGAFKLHMDALSYYDDNMKIEYLVITDQRKGPEDMKSEILDYFSEDPDLCNYDVEDITVLTFKSEKGIGDAIIFDFYMAKTQEGWVACWDVPKYDSSYTITNIEEIESKQSTYMGAVELWIEAVKERDYGKYSSVKVFPYDVIEENKERYGYEEAAMVYEYLNYVAIMGDEDSPITIEEQNIDESAFESAKSTYGHLGDISDFAMVTIHCDAEDAYYSDGFGLIEIDGLWYMINY